MIHFLKYVRSYWKSDSFRIEASPPRHVRLSPMYSLNVAVLVGVCCFIPSPVFSQSTATDTESKSDFFGMRSFQTHVIAEPEGKNFGQTSAVDIDKDGDIDFISGTQKGVVQWFENKQHGSQWETHTIGSGAKTDVAGIAMDVDGDGWIDQVSSGTWFRNPGEDKVTGLWESYATGAIPAHDNLAGDINGDGRLDLIAIRDRDGVFWYNVPDDPRMPWNEHKLIGVTVPQCHGGIAIGDIDGEGDLDVSRLDRWLENADGKGEKWIERPIAQFGKVGPWGIQTRAELLDLDGDDDLDLVQIEGDVLDGRLAWFENTSGDGKAWETHLIRGEGHHQDFHSLSVADFDNDGDVDFFSGGGPLTEGIHLWFIWENRGNNQWREHVVAEGKRTHESVAVDVDGDGDIDILTKPWGGNAHLFAENQLLTTQPKEQ